MIVDTHISEEPEISTLAGVETHREQPDEVSLLDLCIPLAKKKQLILKVTGVFAVGAAIISLLMANQYTAVTQILPPQQTQSSASAMLGQMGALAGLVGVGAGGIARDLGLKSPADLYIGVLQSRTIADDLVARFNMKHYYRGFLSIQDLKPTDVRQQLADRTTIEAGKDGLISISVEDKDPAFAAQIANAYVEELHKANQRLALTEAGQRRVFYESQLDTEKNRLADAEVELKKTQESTGLIELTGQADAIIRSVAALQAQIAAKEVQLQATRSFGTDQNPDVVLLEQELSGLRAELAKAERDEKLGGGNIEVPTGKVPEVGLEYVRKLREVKYHEELFEILAKQFEAAKIDEAKSSPVVQVVDAAVPPDKKSGPIRSLIVIFAAIVGCMFACIYVWMSEVIARMKSDPEHGAKMHELGSLLAFRR